MKPRFLILLGLVAALLGGAPAAWAHALNMTRVMITSPAPRELTIQIDVDLSILLGSYDAYGVLLRDPQPARLTEVGRQILREVGLRLDGTLIEHDPASWSLPETPPEKVGDQTIASMTTFRYAEKLPPGNHEITVQPGTMAKIEFPLAYTFSIPVQSLLLTRWLELPGAVSRVMRIADVAAAPVAPATAVATTTAAAPASAPDVSAASAAADPTAAITGPTVSSPAPAMAPVGPSADEFTANELAIARFISTSWEHLRLGFRHIFPKGIDHVLFVLGLFFLSAKWRPLVSQTTVFTIAHTTTLGLSSYGIISLPPRIVEPLIALSIAYVAIENIVRPKLGPARLVVVFAFGLLHGLGFAGSLNEVPLPKDQFLTALLAFNFGVDFGQLFVIALAFFAVGWFRDKPWYRPYIVIPACGLIGAVGLYWTVLRAFG